MLRVGSSETDGVLMLANIFLKFLGKHHKINGIFRACDQQSTRSLQIHQANALASPDNDKKIIAYWLSGEVRGLREYQSRQEQIHL